MSAKYEELIAAGAPRLPEGYYYKIQPRRVGVQTYLYVEIWKVQRRRDKRVGQTLLLPHNVNTMWDLAWMCKAAHKKAFADPTLPSWVDDFIGRHP